MNSAKKAALIIAAAGAAAAGSAGTALADSHAGAVAGSPGVLSGNVIQVPVNIPINLCGNTIDAVGILNPAIGNVCFNH